MTGLARKMLRGATMLRKAADTDRGGLMRITLAVIAAFAGGYAAVHGALHFLPEEVLAAVSRGWLGDARDDGQPETGVFADADDVHDDDDDDDDDDDAPVAQLELRDDERILIFPPGVAEANGLMVASAQETTWVERYSSLGVVLDVANLLEDVASLRATELVLEQSKARMEPLRARLERLRTAYETGLVLLADVDLAERGLREEEMVQAEHAASHARTLQTIEHRWGSKLASAAADRAPLISHLADRTRTLIQASLPEAFRDRPFQPELRVAGAVRGVELLGPGYAEIPGMGSDAVLLLTDGAGLRPGLRVEVAFESLEGGEPGFVLPTGAVLFHGDGVWTYAALGNDRYLRRPLESLRRIERGWFVPATTLGLDERIVVRGGQMLLAEEFRADIMREDDD